MIDTTNGWQFLNIPTPFLDELKTESILTPYELTHNGLVRAKANTALNEKICDFFELGLDVGFYKTPPGWFYKFHRDNSRNCAFNQLLVDNEPEFINMMIFGKTPINIPYSTDKLCLINTGMPHNVINQSTDKTRILLNIGVNKFRKYSDIVQHLKRRGLIDS